MTEISERYGRLSDVFAQKVAGVPDSKWQNQSPCDDWTARDVVRHVIDTQGMFLGFVGREMGDLPSVDDDPVAAWDAACAKVQDGLDDPTIAKDEFDGFFGRSSFEAAVDRFLVFDLVVHGWDLAHATGQDDRIDPADVARTQKAAEAFGDKMRGPGAFGPEVVAPVDADPQARLLAFLGRRG